MARASGRWRQVLLVLALVVTGSTVGLGVGPAGADVSAVKGSAFGFLSNVSLLNSPASAIGPSPNVTLPAGGSANPVTGSAPSGTAKYGPAVIFTSGQMNVSTQGTTGAGGSVTSSSSVGNVGPGPFTADSAASTCKATETGVTGSTTLANADLVTKTDANGDPLMTVMVPANPAPNTTYNGTVDTVGDTFKYVFNEQIANSDGSLTVNAAHMYLLGPTAKGDLFIGQSVCGVNATAATTSTTTAGATTTTAAQGATTTTSPTSTTAALTTTAAAAPTAASSTTITTAAPATTTSVSGGAFGYSTSVSLFGGAATPRGPAPSVTLPATGSSTAITDSAPSAEAKYGPATVFTSDRLDVSTQGTTGAGGSVTSSATVQNPGKSGQGDVFTATTASSSCTASASGATGSTKLTGGKLTLSEGANPDSDADDTVVQLAAEPAPNTPYQGKIESVGDTFRVVVNEQQRSGGAITVNAVHVFLLGPTAVGDVIVGQSRCGLTASAATTGGGGTAAAAGTPGMPKTGTDAVRLTALALAFLLAGGAATTAAGRQHIGRVARHPFARGWR